MIANLLALLMARLPQFKNEEGQGMAEYGLILALIAVAVIVALGLMGDQLIAVFTDVEGELGTALQ